MAKMEEIIPINEKRSEEFFCEEALTQASSMKDDRGEFPMNMGKNFLNAKFIKKSKNPQLKEVFMASLPKKAQDRKKNKWQTMKNEGVRTSESMNMDYDEQVQTSTKLDSSEKIQKKGSGGWRRLRAEVSEQDGDGQNFEGLGLGSVYQKNKEKPSKGTNRKRGNLKKNKNNGIIEERNNLWTQTNMQNSTGNHYGLSIMSSYGKNPADLVIQEDDQKTRETRVAKEYQTDIPELDLDHNISDKKMIKMVWSPEIFSEESLAAYFAKLQGLLGCKGINEEKAIKMLGKKNMIQEDVIVTVKKNEKFYSNFLGTSSFIREIKHKKSSEDVK